MAINKVYIAYKYHRIQTDFKDEPLSISAALYSVASHADLFDDLALDKLTVSQEKETLRFIKEVLKDYQEPLPTYSEAEIERNIQETLEEFKRV